MTKQFTVGGDGADADPDIFAKLYKNVFGAKMRLATGFPGTSDIALAMQRGEVHGLCGISWSTIKSQHGSWVKDRKINLLVQAAPAKHAELPNVPLASEFARTTEQRQILDFVMVSQSMARPFAAPPGLAKERLQILRESFERMLKDPEFAAEAKKQLDWDGSTYLNGEQMQKKIEVTVTQPPDVIKRIKETLEES
jgi:tripartite-type tricarboxylate transporter receptor subunit TctC